MYANIRISSYHLLQLTARVPFSAMFQDRAVMSSKEWRHQIQEVDADVYRSLRHSISGGFDEGKYGSRIGFSNLKG